MQRPHPRKHCNLPSGLVAPTIHIMTASRISWMDTLRGIAILLLVVWHSSAIPVYYGYDMPTWLLLTNETVLPWRMPTLMFLSGLLLHKSIVKAPATYYVGKIRALAWPYLIWAAIHITTFPYYVGALTSPKSWIANGYLWFIFFLLAYYLIARIVVRAPWWATMLVCIGAASAMPVPLIQNFFYFAIFFFAGHYLRRIVHDSLSWPRQIYVAALVLTVAFTPISLWLTWSTDSHYFQHHIGAVPVVFVMIFVGVRIAARLGREYSDRWVVRRMNSAGRNSIIFYLTHFPVITAVCGLAGLLDLPLGLWIVPSSWIAAIAVGSALTNFRDSVPFCWLFQAPSFSRRRQRVGLHRSDA